MRQYARILSERRFSFAVVNSGAMGMALTYVSLAPNVLMGTAGLTPLQFSLVFGANGFWIMLVSFFANRIIHKVGRPVCLATGGMLMGLGCSACCWASCCCLQRRKRTGWRICCRSPAPAPGWRS